MINHVTIIFSLIASATFSLTYRVAFGHNTEEIGKGGSAFYWMSKPVKQVEATLLSLKNKSIAIYTDDIFFSCWLSYYARHNKVWLVNSPKTDKCMKDSHLPSFEKIPENYYLLLPIKTLKINPQLHNNIVWQNVEFALLMMKKQHVLFTSCELNQQNQFYQINFYSMCNGSGRFYLDVKKQLKTNKIIDFTLDANKKYHTVLKDFAGSYMVNLPVNIGENIIRIHANYK